MILSASGCRWMKDWGHVMRSAISKLDIVRVPAVAESILRRVRLKRKRMT